MDRDVHRYRAFLGITVWLLLLLSVRASRAAGTPAPANTDFDVVTVDLNAQTFDRVLPFDVPFIITGAVPPGITSLEVRCWILEFDKKHNPILLSDDALSKKLVNPDGDCWNGKVLVWNNTIDPGVANPMFRVLAPPLEAEQAYQFKLSFEKQVTPEEAQTFAQKVREIVDSSLWGSPKVSSDLPLAGSLTAAEVKDIRDQLIQALKQVTKADRVLEPGTIFSESAAIEVIRKFNLLLLPIRDSQAKISETAKDYQGEVESLVPNLRKIRTDPLLQKLRDALEKLAKTDPGAQCHADLVDDVMSLKNPPVLRSQDRRSAADFSAFLDSSDAYFSGVSTKIDDLKNLLTGTADGCPSQPPLGSLGLTNAELASLAAMAQTGGLVGSLDLTVVRSLVSRLQRDLQRRAQAVADIAEEYRAQVERMVVVAGSTTGSFQTQSSNYISADTGIACAPELTTCSVYVGTNFYFRPVNKAAPLSQFGPFFSRASFSRRASLTLGLTANGIGDDKTREDLFGTQSLVYGFGVRMTNSVRFTAGGLLFRKLSPNPLSTDKKLATTYFVSVSFDIDVAPALKGFGGLFKP